MENRTQHARNVLVVSYAFPPLQVPMAPCVAKAAAAIQSAGYKVEVVTVQPRGPLQGPQFRDESLLPYIDTHFAGGLTRLSSTGSLWYRRIQWGKRRFKHLLLRSMSLSRKFWPFPLFSSQSCRWSFHLQAWVYSEVMTPFHDAMYRHLCERLETGAYTAVVSFSPFHAINPVMVDIKRKFPAVTWIAQFSDPWAGNPLEHNRFAQLWAQKMEPQTLEAADYVVYNSDTSRALMMQQNPGAKPHKTAIIPHPFDASLYPARGKNRASKITLRHVGTLFENRTPEPLFVALAALFARKPELRTVVQVELIGTIDRRMLLTPAALALPAGVIVTLPGVPYTASLEAIYDADILLLIEANVTNHLFMPSKLSDYLGAGVPILAIIPEGPARDTLMQIESQWVVSPADIDGISRALETVIAAVQHRDSSVHWGDGDVRAAFSLEQVGKEYSNLIEKVNAA